MQENQPDLLTDDVFNVNNIRRKKLLPLWIKIFMWFFLILGILIPVIVIIGILGNSAQLAVYGLETTEPFSLTGIIILIIFLIKGITSFGLLKEKDWAIKIGIVDAILGIAICVGLMIYPIINPDFKFSLRLELIALIPYLIKLLKIKTEWKNAQVQL